MIDQEVKYSYNDLTIVPSVVSSINSRKEVTVTYDNGMLPLFAAPMSSVVSIHNMNNFIMNGIIPVLPRNIDYEERKHQLIYNRWVAFSLNEFEELFCSGNTDWCEYQCITFKVLIDIANGHMNRMLELVRKAKEQAKGRLYSLVIMAGNVANPKSYIEYADAGVDFIRAGIGGGMCCITSSNLGIHYPMGSLISELYDEKQKLRQLGGYTDLPKIVADGGIRNFSDIIKALALGADYVMVGSIFGGFLESAAPWEETEYIYKKDDDNYSVSLSRKYDVLDSYDNYQDYDRYIYTVPEAGMSKEEIKRIIVSETDLKKNIYGMSTKKAQQEISGTAVKTSEGIERTVDVRYTMKQWTDNMEAYLRSAMSYCNSLTLYDFIGKQRLIPNSPAAQLSVNK